MKANSSTVNHSFALVRLITWKRSETCPFKGNPLRGKLNVVTHDGVIPGPMAHVRQWFHLLVRVLHDEFRESKLRRERSHLCWVFASRVDLHQSKVPYRFKIFHYLDRMRTKRFTNRSRFCFANDKVAFKRVEVPAGGW